jgi:primosomal protein N' (replication factor Y)
LSPSGWKWAASPSSGKSSRALTPEFCDVSLPVPLDRAFTYALPLTLRHRAQVGARVIVPFGARKLSGVIVSLRGDYDGEAREVEKLLDEAPVFDEHLMRLAQWIASYYSAPLGEVFRGMAPLAGEIGRRRSYRLTPAGLEIARRLTPGAAPSPDPAIEILRLLERRTLSEATLVRSEPKAASALRTLIKKGLVAMDDQAAPRDPLRSPADRLEAEFVSRTEETLPKRERELLAFLELHPGMHRLSELEETIPGAATAARSLARRGLARVQLIAPAARVCAPALRFEPNAQQQAALQAVSASIAAGTFETFLLHGVTGSGKTEVYLRAIDAALEAGKSALMLVPEIALTPAVAAQFAARFGDRVAILHSAFNDTERASQWRRIRSGEVRVAIGTRSAVFAPLERLGLIVVDEEHDSSYKQEETPRYHGRDVAVMRAQMLGACVVLGSATPSLESRYNAETNRYRLLELPERIEQRPLPAVELVDMRTEFLETRKNSLFSRRMIDAVHERLGAGEQVMLLMNRRGFSSFVTCRACGHRMMCENCAVTLTYHRGDRRLLCHYCNYAERVPERCPACASEYLQFVGSGSERVEDELHQHFPTARIARLDRDTVSGKQDHEAILHGFREGAYDILVGTQMIAKGHDIPNVTFVGIVSADIGLSIPDFRAAERTFQLLTQAAGRAGRGNIPGSVLIQTLNPDHYAIRFAAAQDYRLFYEKELQFRRALRYPPFSALAKVLVRAEDREDAMRMSGEIETMLTPMPEGLRVIGPGEAPVPRLKREYRFQLLLKSASRRTLAEHLARVRRHAIEAKWAATALVIDVDPMSLL